MASSTITLYTREIGIEAEKLQMIEDFEAYLESKATSLAIVETYQYQKIELTKFLKVDISQSFQSPVKSQNYIYCKIVNSDNAKPIYYWIKKMNWKSQSCIELELVLDTLNTFKIGTDYTFSPKTIIQRQHKDRIYSKMFYKYYYDEITLGSIQEWESGSYYNMDKSKFITGYIQYNFGEIIFDNAYAYLYVWDSIKHIMMSWPQYKGWTSTTEVKFNKIKYDSFADSIYLMEDDRVVLQDFGIDIAELPSNISIVLTASNPYINNDQDDTLLFLEMVVGEITERQQRKYLRKVDLMEEGLNPQLYGGEYKEIQDKLSNNKAWYLVYNTASDEAVEGYLIPETPQNVKAEGLSDKRITPSMLGTGYIYIVLERLGGTGDYYTYFTNDGSSTILYGRDNFKMSNGNNIPYPSTYPSGTRSTPLLQLRNVNGMIYGEVFEFVDTSASNDFKIRGAVSFITNYLVYTGSEATIKYGRTSTDIYNGSATDIDNVSSTIASGNTWQPSQIIELGSIDNLNRTLSTLLKVIKLPYCPYDFDIDSSNILVMDNNFTLTNWNGITNVLKLNNLNIDLRHLLDVNETIKSPNEEYMRFNSISSLLSNRNDFYESKMYHSEFFTPKFTYDSFSFIYKFELEDIEKVFDKYNYDDLYISTKFVMTRTINSRFAFEFTDYIVNKKEDDYPNWLLIARNNEEVIYNSAYLNYIRTGYNYDVKNKQAQATRNWVSVGASLVTAVVGLVGSAVSGGAALPLALMGVTGVISASATITNAISTTAQNERSIQEKLDTLKLQTASVSGSDDVDLMTRYNGNRLLYLTYKVNERVDKLLKDLFYYYGYKDNISGVPVVNTRYWFNHLKCEPILEFTSLNITQEIEEELKGIMRNGFTIFHKRLVNNVATWDIEQVKENWEVSMLPYLS